MKAVFEQKPKSSLLSRGSCPGKGDKTRVPSPERLIDGLRRIGPVPVSLPPWGALGPGCSGAEVV